VAILVAAVVGRAGRWEQPEPARPAQAVVTSSSLADAPAVTAAAKPVRRSAAQGVPLLGPTGLRLLISSELVPIVLDVDRGTIQVVAVWRPGEPRIAVRQVRLPPGAGGSFVLW